MMRLSAVSLAAALLFGTALPLAAETVTVNFVQTNDIDRMEEHHGRGGFARLAGVLDEVRAEGPTFFVHAGDTLSPSLLSGIDHGAHIIDILNAMGVDAFTPGNHEFDFGPDVFRERMREAKFPVITSNVREKDGASVPNAVDDRIVEVEGVRFAFYGLTTEDTPQVASPGDMSFAPSVETAKKKAAALRAAGADIVVAVVHTPLSVDMALVRDKAADLIFSGHDEHLLVFFDGATALTESGSQADSVVVTRLTVDKETKDGKTTVTFRPDFEIVDSASVEPDPAIKAKVDGYLGKLDKELKVAIGTTQTALDSRRATVRATEAAIGNLIADAMRETVGADVGLMNGGGIRADREYAPGTTLTRADVFAELPFGNKTVKIAVTGEKLKAAIENGLSLVEAKAGRFPQVSGMVVTADLSKLPGSRVESITVDGAPLDPAKTYTLATNDFVADGGDGYTVLADAARLISPVDAQLLASQVIAYVEAKKTVAPAVEGRLVLR
ncbi:bifunctional metallophosphatase/5'-nucleotidase [Prosthecomicrobium pneumaticum]|uniref:2',3'-cyclic-nucleotide 2'-phosphodiesterase (5'-nucleotidase family) n=1 Tax=Prosthecomicrobium pneumaticum TaxID=81895 RepID=A0A7W9CWA0_9HYPH|nr:bifunctional UDP-sugar hydrolase/5'-nucleotidase [Prosthecomicrobium pneumaticum]MBB5752522.1 2',3'-cyclic-nucleotide 2'-phosphodiesterase (5'-nucleotidase family) [Prosthecomicrobium pneumaticum]